MKVGIYARGSTVDKGQDVDLQLKDLRIYVQARDWHLYQEYLDEGQSGSKDKRPALDLLMNDCRKRKVDAVLVWRLDRFGRSLKHMINTLDELRQLEYPLSDTMRTLISQAPLGSTGLLLFHLLGLRGI